ncbi:hypothetical protein PR202_gb23504 [Eleusine coracana subsp. coracana]|uniref:Uncharacterized protein n=1 Tax=Eleusine coracana subsp. coracana TaxID=191504 RepID=A0AAV5FJB6_ELECO|nr:hypothetical protein PR202_gb23504 [Eleusine coracana subsp. coracana]
MMQSFLSVTNEEEIQSNVVSTWVTQVRDLAYDVEDGVEFVVHMDTKCDWWRRLIPSCMRRPLPLDEAVDIMEQLKARVQDVSQRNERYRLIIDSGSNPGKDTKQLAPRARHTDTQKQRDLDALIMLITKNRREFQVISVWVPGGDPQVAATIRKAYNSHEDIRKFECRAWVRLSQPFNIQTFIRSLLDLFHTNAYEENQRKILGVDAVQKNEANMEEDDYLLHEFTNIVKKNRYLIILEDFSATNDEWSTIRKYLPETDNGSRMVVITKHFQVASFCIGYPHIQQFWADYSLCVLSKEVRTLLQ